MESNKDRGASIARLRSSKRAFVSRHEPHISFEFFPPKTAAGWTKLKRAGSRLAEFRPHFSSVTFGAGGSVREKTLEACLVLKESMGVDVVPHLVCLGLSQAELSGHLQSFEDAGIKSLLALRGDVPVEFQSGADMQLPEDGFRHASQLVSFVKKRGGFHIFVSCYPEGHPEAPSLQIDIDNFRRKVDAGADAAITQYFFNNAAYFHFVEELRSKGVDTPVVVGLMPLFPYDQVLRFSERCGADVPLWMRKRMEGYQDDPASQADFAIEVAVRQSEELLGSGAPGIHFYTLNRYDLTERICEQLRAQRVDDDGAWGDAPVEGEFEIPASLS